MGRQGKFSPEVRERAVRLVLETQEQHASEWAAITSVASKIWSCGPYSCTLDLTAFAP